MAEHDTFKFFARWRFIALASLVAALLNLAISIARLVYGIPADRVVWTWVTAVATAVWAASAVWILTSTRHPLVTVTTERVVVWPYGGERKELPLDQVQSLRWQDSFDLRLRCQSGEEYAVPLQGVSRRERALLEHVLAARIGARALMSPSPSSTSPG